MLQTIENRYRDIDISFRKNPKTGDIYELRDIEAVKRAVKLLVLTQFHEIPFHPEIGSAINSSLFDNFTASTKLKIKRSIKDVIYNFEPRARLLEVNISETEDNHGLFVDVYFSIINVPEPIVIQINLERVR